MECYYHRSHSSALTRPPFQAAGGAGAATQELEAARAKTSSLQMECDLYRQECDKAWAINATLQKRCSTAEAEANAQALALAAAAQTGDASPSTSGGGIVGATDQLLDGSGAEAWFMQEPVDDRAGGVPRRLGSARGDRPARAEPGGAGAEPTPSGSGYGLRLRRVLCFENRVSAPV